MDAGGTWKNNFQNLPWSGAARKIKLTVFLPPPCPTWASLRRPPDPRSGRASSTRLRRRELECRRGRVQSELKSTTRRKTCEPLPRETGESGQRNIWKAVKLQQAMFVNSRKSLLMHKRPPLHTVLSQCINFQTLGIWQDNCFMLGNPSTWLLLHSASKSIKIVKNSYESKKDRKEKNTEMNTPQARHALWERLVIRLKTYRWKDKDLKVKILTI